MSHLRIPDLRALCRNSTPESGIFVSHITNYGGTFSRMIPYRFLSAAALILSYSIGVKADVEVVDKAAAINPIKTAYAAKRWIENNVTVTDQLRDPIIKSTEDAGVESALDNWSADIKLPDSSSSYITAESNGKNWRVNSGYNIRRNDDHRIGVSYLELASASGVYLNLNLGREWSANGLYVKLGSDTLVPTDAHAGANYQAAHATLSYTPLAAGWMTLTAKAQIACRLNNGILPRSRMEFPYYDLDLDMSCRF